MAGVTRHLSSLLFLIPSCKLVQECFYDWNRELSEQTNHVSRKAESTTAFQSSAWITLDLLNKARQKAKLRDTEGGDYTVRKHQA